MSDHGKDAPELRAALEKHGLPADKPSQLADAFRLGWNTRAAPKEFESVADEIAEGSGWWASCSGCHETNEGCETGWYSYSKAFQCYLGAGCSECGGLGVVWNTAWTDEDVARALTPETET